MKNFAILLYSVLSYFIFLAVFVYAIGFIGNIGVTNSLDSLPSQPFYIALAVNLGLLSLFAVQHSIMARRWFKDWMTRFIPAEAERATYVLFSNIAMILLFIYWEPMGGIVWQVESELFQSLLLTGFSAGWLVLLLSTFLIDHFHLFGLKQAWYRWKGKDGATTKFVTPLFYKMVRHPIYLGWLIIFWCAPTMSVAHLVFTLLSTAYIFVGIYFEEADLRKEFGETYRAYQSKVAMVVPFVK